MAQDCSVGFWNCSTLDFLGRDILFLSFVFQARELSDVRKENQQSRRNRGGGRGAPPPHILADMLSLFQSGWVQIIPSTLLLVHPSPPVFRPSYGPAERKKSGSSSMYFDYRVTNVVFTFDLELFIFHFRTNLQSS